MAYNIFIQKEKNIYSVVFPKCGWTLFWAHYQLPKSKFVHITNNSFPARKVKMDAFFIRDPIERIISGFKNKYRDNPDKDRWTRDWLIKVMNLPNKREIANVSFDQFLDKLEEFVLRGKEDFKTEFFRNGPSNYFDTHFCPMSYQLRFFPQEDKLFFDIRKDLDYLDYLGIDYTRRENSSHYVPFKATSKQRERIAGIYKEDVILYDNYEKSRINRPPIEELFKK